MCLDVSNDLTSNQRAQHPTNKAVRSRPKGKAAWGAVRACAGGCGGMAWGRAWRRVWRAWSPLPLLPSLGAPTIRAWGQSGPLAVCRRGHSSRPVGRAQGARPKGRAAVLDHSQYRMVYVLSQGASKRDGATPLCPNLICHGGREVPHPSTLHLANLSLIGHSLARCNGAH